MNNKDLYLNNEDEGSKLTRADYDKLNEAIIRKNPALGRLNERIIYDKEFLLEVSSAGYNTLDKEDVLNFIQGLPPKNLERNLIACGAIGPNKVSNNLGMSMYGEDEVTEFRRENPEIGLALKYEKDVEKHYLSDYTSKKSIKALMNADENENFIDLDQRKNKQPIVLNEEEQFESNASRGWIDIEDNYRKHVAQAFGSDDMVVPKKQQEQVNNIKETVHYDGSTEKLLTLIKEFRALGFTPDEIKKEIQKLV